MLAILVTIFRLGIGILQTVIFFNFNYYNDNVDVKGTVLLAFLLLLVGATYAKVFMGFFILAPIIILTIQIKQKYTESIDRIAWWLYFGITVWNLAWFIVLIIYTLYMTECWNKYYKDESKECRHYTKIGIKYNSAFFALLSVTLVLAVIPLFHSFRKIRQGRHDLN